MGSSFGQQFRIATWGESHGGGVGVTIDGCPAGMELSEADIQPDLDRRRPGQSRVTTPRDEADRCEILSGVFEGRTLGTSIAILVRNQDQRSSAYEDFKHIYRPGHADYTYQAKYGYRTWQGGGRASAREAIGRVAAGAVAKKILAEKFGTRIVGWVQQVHTIAAETGWEGVTPEAVEANMVRCPDPATAERMIERIDQARNEGDSVGGIVRCVAENVPPGLGDPVFDKLDADIAKAMMSIPACKGVEIGDGFSSIALTGKEHNDAFYMEGDRVRTRTNHAGGILGGISDGEPVRVSCAFKPTATIAHPQESVDDQGNAVTLKAKGRHDPCVLPRAVPIVESMLALVLADHWLRQAAYRMGE
ncbi:MAG: chorismate synthase [Nitrospirota bacterium]|nr:chorismate synthase [Nitrospirota bacterium]